MVLGLVSSVLCQEIGWEERLRNDLSCVGVGRKTLTQSNSSLQTHYTRSFSLVIIMTIYYCLPDQKHSPGLSHSFFFNNTINAVNVIFGHGAVGRHNGNERLILLL